MPISNRWALGTMTQSRMGAIRNSSLPRRTPIRVYGRGLWVSRRTLCNAGIMSGTTPIPPCAPSSLFKNDTRGRGIQVTPSRPPTSYTSQAAGGCSRRQYHEPCPFSLVADLRSEHHFYSNRQLPTRTGIPPTVASNPKPAYSFVSVTVTRSMFCSFA